MAGGPGRGLPGLLARFGELAGRDLSARACTALRARGGYDPLRHGDAGSCRPLTAAEQLELLALRAAITGDDRAAPAGLADAGLPERPVRPVRLRRPSYPESRREARHSRPAGRS